MTSENITPLSFKTPDADNSPSRTRFLVPAGPPLYEAIRDQEQFIGNRVPGTEWGHDTFSSYVNSNFPRIISSQEGPLVYISAGAPGSGKSIANKRALDRVELTRRAGVNGAPARRPYTLDITYEDDGERRVTERLGNSNPDAPWPGYKLHDADHELKIAVLGALNTKFPPDVINLELPGITAYVPQDAETSSHALVGRTLGSETLAALATHRRPFIDPTFKLSIGLSVATPSMQIVSINQRGDIKAARNLPIENQVTLLNSLATMYNLEGLMPDDPYLDHRINGMIRHSAAPEQMQYINDQLYTLIHHFHKHYNMAPVNPAEVNEFYDQYVHDQVKLLPFDTATLMALSRWTLEVGRLQEAMMMLYNVPNETGYNGLVNPPLAELLGGANKIELFAHHLKAKEATNQIVSPLSPALIDALIAA